MCRAAFLFGYKAYARYEEIHVWMPSSGESGKETQELLSQRVREIVKKKQWICVWIQTGEDVEIL